MAAGRYDKRIVIESASSSLDAGGNATLTWTTAATRWGSLLDSAGREMWRAQQVDATIDAVIELREEYVGLGVDDRLVTDGRTFNIKAVLGSSDRTPKRGQIVHCKEEV
jgi:SPP1 family predicted phage head-tail adaptor